MQTLLLLSLDFFSHFYLYTDVNVTEEIQIWFVTIFTKMFCMSLFSSILAFLVSSLANLFMNLGFISFTISPLQVYL